MPIRGFLSGQRARFHRQNLSACKSGRLGSVRCWAVTIVCVQSWRFYAILCDFCAAPIPPLHLPQKAHPTFIKMLYVIHNILAHAVRETADSSHNSPKTRLYGGWPKHGFGATLGRTTKSSVPTLPPWEPLRIEIQPSVTPFT